MLMAINKYSEIPPAYIGLCFIVYIVYNAQLIDNQQSKEVGL